MFLLFFLKLLIKSLTNASFFCDLGINVKNELHRIDSKKMSDTKKTPEHQAAYETLRNMILLGRFAPGQPLTIQGLADALNVGMTPAREAIRRLVAENALETLGNRRVALPLLDQSALEDIYMLRLEIEPELTSRAVKKTFHSK